MKEKNDKTAAIFITGIQPGKHMSNYTGGVVLENY